MILSLLRKWGPVRLPFLWLGPHLPALLIFCTTPSVARADQKAVVSGQPQTMTESERLLSPSSLAQITAMEMYAASSGKVLLVITVSNYVQPEVLSTGLKSITLRLPETELSRSAEKIIDIPPDATAIATVEAKSNSQLRAVDFSIELNESVPYSIKPVGNEILVEFAPIVKSSADHNQSDSDLQEEPIELSIPKETVDTELTHEVPEKKTTAAADESAAETNDIQEGLPLEAKELQLSDEEVAGYLPAHSKFDAFMNELFEGFRYEIRLLPTETSNKVSDSPANPQNILEIPRYVLGLEVRPDFYLDYRNLRLSLQPRNTFTWSKWEDGIKAGKDDFDIDLFVNYWLAGIQMTDSLWVSYGRENLQWGPSYYVSPSNIFFRDNGLGNPKLEVPGQDFARTVWAPTSWFSGSFIANTNEGEAEYPEGFERAYALKLDLTGYQKYLSLIGSYRENDRAYLGGYAGWTVTEGLLLYFEGQASQGTSVYYPVKTERTILGERIIELDDKKKNSDSLEAELLGGISYTFESGPTLTLEYFRNTPGYSKSQVNLLFDFADQVDRVLGLPPIIANLPRFDLNFDAVANIQLRRLRENYLMLQCQQAQIQNVLNLLLRYTYNLDDNGSQLIPMILYDWNDNIQLFVIGSQNFGDKDDEFRLFADYSYFIGLQYTF